MADFVKTFKLIIDADGRAAIAGLESVGKAAGKTEGEANASLAKISGGLTKVGVGAIGVAVAGGAALVKLTGNFSSAALSADKMSKATGLTTESASRFIEVSGDLGLETSKVTVALGKLNKAAETIPDQFKEIGAAIVRTKSGAVDVQATFLNVVDALNKIEDPAKRQVAAAALLGKGWQDMAQLIGEGSTKLKASLADVADAKVFDGSEVTKAEAYRDSMDHLHDSVQELGLSLGQGAAPLISKFSDAVGTAVDVVGKADSVTHGAAGEFLALATVGLGAAGVLSVVVGQGLKLVDNFGRVKTALTNAEGGLTGFGSAAKGAATALGALGLVIVAADVINKVTSDSDRASKALDTLTLQLQRARGGGNDAASGIRLVADAAKELEASKGQIDKTFDAFAVSGPFNLTVSKARLNLLNFKEALDKALASDPAAGAQIRNSLIETARAADAGDVAARKYLDSLGLSNAEIDKLVDKLNLAQAAQGAAARTTTDTADATKAATSVNQDYAESFDDVTRRQRGASIGLSEVATSTEELSRATSSLAVDQDTLTRNQKAALIGLSDIARDTDTLTDSTDRLISSYQEQLKAMDAVATSLADQNDVALKSQQLDLDRAAALDKYNESLAGQAPDAKAAAVAQRELTEAQQKYNDSLKVTPATDIDKRKAALDLADAQAKATAVQADAKATDLDRQKSLLAVDEAQQKYDKTLAGTVDTADQQAAALKNLKDAQEKLGEATKGTTATTAEQKQSFLDIQFSANAAAKGHADYVRGLAEGVGAAFSERDAINAQIESLDEFAATLAPGSELSNAILSHIAELHRAAAEAAGYVNQITTLHGAISGTTAGARVGPQASGGPAYEGVTTHVAEFGPELFEPNAPGPTLLVGTKGPGLFTPPASGKIVPYSEVPGPVLKAASRWSPSEVKGAVVDVVTVARSMLEPVGEVASSPAATSTPSGVAAVASTSSRATAATTSTASVEPQAEQKAPQRTSEPATARDDPTAVEAPDPVASIGKPTIIRSLADKVAPTASKKADAEPAGPKAGVAEAALVAMQSVAPKEQPSWPDRLVAPKALGGPVRKGDVVPVGEKGVEVFETFAGRQIVGAKGPQLFIAPTDGRIVSSAEIATPSAPVRVNPVTAPTASAPAVRLASVPSPTSMVAVAAAASRRGEVTAPATWKILQPQPSTVPPATPASATQPASATPRSPSPTSSSSGGGGCTITVYQYFTVDASADKVAIGRAIEDARKAYLSVGGRAA